MIFVSMLEESQCEVQNHTDGAEVKSEQSLLQ